ncbi:MAG: hypothetical protein VB118_05335 [Oscillospiraceae bacterium]|nr:hypothetical protein [Oscillospiraceae bacterium]
MTNNLKSNEGYTANYVEYLVPRKNTGKVLAQKILIILALVVVFIVSSAFLLEKMPAIGAVYALLFIILGWYLWRFVSVEYEYVIAAGEMEMEAIYGRRQRKKLCGFKLADVEFCAPVEEQYKNRIESPDIKKKIIAADSMSSPSLYFIIYKDANGQKQLLYFNAIKKAVDILKFYRRDIIVASDKLIY